MDVKDLIERLKMDVTCPICSGYFCDPVLVKCGHTFCKECLLRLWKKPHISTTCPNCKAVIEFGDFICNRSIRENTINGMLLRPYLLQSIRDLSTCDKHGKEEIFFCEEDQRPLCGSCSLATEHKDHKVTTLSIATRQFMKKLQATQNILKSEIKKFQMRLKSEKDVEEWWMGHGPVLKYVVIAEYEEMYNFFFEKEKLQFRKLYKELKDNLRVPETKSSKSKEILKQPMTSKKQLVEMFKATKESVKLEFDKKRKLLSETKELHLQRLDKEVKDNLAKIQENKAKVTQHIHNLQVAMAEIENNFDKLPMEMLKDAKNTLESNEKLLLQNPVLSSPTWTKNPIPGRTEMLLTFLRDITLDPETASPHVILSDDLKRVELVSVPQDEAEIQENFDHPLQVLGIQSFTSGKHYWEIEVENIKQWEVGICEQTIITENGQKVPQDEYNIFTFSRARDCGLELSGDDVPVSQQTHKMGIFLDYERGHMALYNATDGTLISSPHKLFLQGPVRPAFCPSFQYKGFTPASIRICSRITS